MEGSIIDTKKKAACPSPRFHATSQLPNCIDLWLRRPPFSPAGGDEGVYSLTATP